MIGLWRSSVASTRSRAIQQLASSLVIGPRKGTRLSRVLLANKPVERLDISVFREPATSDSSQPSELVHNTQVAITGLRSGARPIFWSPIRPLQGVASRG